MHSFAIDRRIKAALQETHSFQIGDSAQQLSRETWRVFFERMQAAIDGRTAWTLVLRDPLANSFIAPCDEDAATDPPPPDPRLAVQSYERSVEEDEEYGIDHLKRHNTGINGNAPTGVHINET